MMQRFDVKGGARPPQKRHLGSDDPKLTEELKHYHDFVEDGRVCMSVIVDPELLKCVMNEMVEEAGVRLYLHSWAGRALVDGGRGDPRGRGAAPPSGHEEGPEEARGAGSMVA